MIKELLKRSFTLKRLVRRCRARNLPHPMWNKMLIADKAHWDSALNTSKGGPKVLIATSSGSYMAGTTLESLIAVALTLRGAEVHILLCDSILPACQLCATRDFPNQKHFICYGPSKYLCIGCFSPVYKMYQSIGISVHRYSDFIMKEDLRSVEQISSRISLSDIKEYKLDGIAVGEHALAGALRFFARGTLHGEPYAEPVLRRYLKASLLTTYATRRLIEKLSVECAVFHHGIYVPQGLIGEVARDEGVRVVNWNTAYRKKCFIFSHNDTYHHTLMSEPVSKWENIPWTPRIDSELMDYLRSRWQGTQDWIWFHEKPQGDLNAIEQELGVDFSKPCIGMLTNVMWDAQLHYPANAFPNMLEWTLQTINYFAKRPELQLIIREHPAEITGFLPSRQRITDEIRRAFPVMPKNIFLIPAESHVSTYAAMLQCNAVIIYGTKTGVELASMGIPVIVAGEAWIRNKGITIDAISAENYFELLNKLPYNQKSDEIALQRARKYAYHFFFRRMIPLEFMELAGGKINTPYTIQLTNGLRDLMPGQSAGLDLICEGILKGTDFIYPAERNFNI